MNLCIKCQDRPKWVQGMCRQCFLADRPWPEQVVELRRLGYQDWEIAKKLGNSPATFARQADRHHMGVDELMREISREQKLKKGWLPA